VPLAPDKELRKKQKEKEEKNLSRKNKKLKSETYETRHYSLFKPYLNQKIYIRKTHFLLKS